MKYMAFIRHSESYREEGPPKALMTAMGEFVQRSLAQGTILDTGGLLPSKEGLRVCLRGTDITVTDGPFTETKEVVGGWAILNAATKAEATKIAREFMELHAQHWPSFEGECEVRAMFEPGAGP